MNKIKKSPIKYFLILIVILILVIYIIPAIPKLFVSSYVLQYGELKLTDEAEVCFVRDENLYVSKTNGKPNYYIQDGTLVRKGTVIMDIADKAEGKPSKKYTKIAEQNGKNIIRTDDFIAENGGIVSFYADGYESELKPSDIKNITYDKFSDIKRTKVRELQRTEIMEGEPAFKLVDRTRWYLVCFVDKESAGRFEKNQQVNVAFEDGNIDGTVREINEERKRLKIVIEVENYYENFACKRTDEAEITTYYDKGLIVNNSSIGTEKKQQGVYVKKKNGQIKFVPIQIKLTDGEKSIVANEFFYDKNGELHETVRIYDEILKKAK